MADEQYLADIEIYPKQDSLDNLEGAGSFVRLPLGLHRKDGKVHYFVDAGGNPLAVTITEQVRLLVAPEKVARDFIDGIIARSPEPRQVSPTPAFEKKPVQSSEFLSKRLVARVSAYDFVSQFVSLDSRGVGYCPFHDDEHHSFQVNTSKNYWNCYAECGGGNVIHFWSKWREKHGQDPEFIPTITELAGMLL